MQKVILIIHFLFLTIHYGLTQTVEIQGELKVSTVNPNNASEDVLVRNMDGSIAKRNAQTIGGVPVSGIVLSEVDDNPILLTAGFLKTGMSLFPFRQSGINGTTHGSWQTSSVVPPSVPGDNASSVWTGNEFIIWGGSVSGSKINLGIRYHPVSDSWTSTSLVNAPAARDFHTANAINGTMIIWGGRNSSNQAINTGSIYDPTSNTWTAISQVNAPSPRYWHKSVVVNNKLIIWSGFNGSTLFNDGGIYDPVTDSWTPVTSTNAPAGRARFAMVNFDHKIMIYGGEDTGGTVNTAGIYNIDNNTWQAVPAAPVGKVRHGGVFTGNELLFYGGTGSTTHVKYNPVSNSWSNITSNPNVVTSANNSDLNCFWTGTEMLVWANGGTSTGGKYNPLTDSWTLINTHNQPTVLTFNYSVWTGNKFITYGSGQAQTGIYDPLPTGFAPPVNKPYYFYEKN